MTDSSKVRETIFRLLDRIEDLLSNLTKIQSELFAVLSEIPPKRSQSEIEDILGIKVYLGENYIDRGGCGSYNIKIGEPIKDNVGLEVEEIAPQYNINGTVIVQDFAGNILEVGESRSPILYKPI
jgi:hypothetical protein